MIISGLARPGLGPQESYILCLQENTSFLAFFRKNVGTSLVAQWLRLLPVQDVWV